MSVYRPARLKGTANEHLHSAACDQLKRIRRAVGGAPAGAVRAVCLKMKVIGTAYDDCRLLARF